MRLVGEWCKLWCCSVTPHTQPRELLVVNQSLEGEGHFREILADASFLLYYYYCTHFCPDLWFPPLWRQCLKWQSHPIAQSWVGMYITAPRNRFRFEVFISELDCCEITIKSFNFVVHSGSKWSEVLDEFCSEVVYTAKLSVITVHYLLCHNSPCGCSLWKTSVDQVLAKW